MLFLQWNLDNYSSRKRTNLRQKFKHWRQLYRKFAERRWSNEWIIEVNDYINEYLTDKYKLDISTKKKPVADVDDVYRALHYNLAGDSPFPDE